MPAVSVIIASYNHAHYIAQTLRSVFCQTCQDFELIVLDDGSTDNSIEVIEALRQEYDFHFEQQTNMGLARTLNKAVALSKGRYIMPLGSDDLMFPDKLEKQLAYMETHPEYGISGGNILNIDGDGKLFEKQKIYEARELSFDDIFLKRKKGVPAPTLMFRRDILEEAGGFNPDIRLEDLYIEFKITSLGYKIGMLNDVLAYYRIHDTNNFKNLDMMLEAVLQTYERFSDHPDYEQMRLSTLNSYLLMAAKSNKPLVRKIIKQIPLKSYRLKTVRGIARSVI